MSAYVNVRSLFCLINHIQCISRKLYFIVVYTLLHVQGEHTRETTISLVYGIHPYTIYYWNAKNTK